MYAISRLEYFQRNIESKYHVYNSVFITLPFDTIDNTGSLLPLFTDVCQQGFAQGKSPEDIISDFTSKYLGNPTEKEQTDLMFRFVQYVERQIVLFDAVEDAAFTLVNPMDGHGSVLEAKDRAISAGKKEELAAFLDRFKVRPVLTAHPTQFYPGSVLGIITDLTKAIGKDDLYEIKRLLSQLGKTPFIKKEKPTPYDEAVSLLWYLENVFYPTSGEILDFINKTIYMNTPQKSGVIQLGFWPGGDRDGNPFVTNEITQKVADRLRTSILKCYYQDIRQLKRRLTFSKVEVLLADLEDKIYRSVFYSKGEVFIQLSELTEQLQLIRSLIITENQSLYLEEIDSLLHKIQIFGYHFASLDIRQNSKVHDKALLALENTVKSNQTIDSSNIENIEDSSLKETLKCMQLIRSIQENNGELGCNRYIISNSNSAKHILDTLRLFECSGWELPSVDIVPLFESIDDLQHADIIMETVYLNPKYASHLMNRKGKQTVMLGFSDGTKDGGYLMANWSIFKAKEAITAMSRKYGIEVIFFDGRGGPPARGGGKTHKFYASLGSQIENTEIQITVQGQTISSNFGTLDSCRFNLENLISAGIHNEILDHGKNDLNETYQHRIQELAEIGYKSYVNFKEHPKFLGYLEKMSALKYYAMVNIGSRPAKRNTDGKLEFDDLRAIPFVGAWSMLKQNVPGFFGVGSALEYFDKSGRWNEIQEVYDQSLFFRTLLENSMMSLAKSFFPLTAYMKEDIEFGDFWTIIFNEYNRSKNYLLKLAKHQELMENYPEGKASIGMRENIVLPLLVIQQFALTQIQKLQESDPESPQIAIYEKLVMRALFGNTNASRNSA